MKTEIRINKTFIGNYYGEVLIFNDSGKVDGYIHTPDFDTEEQAYAFAANIESHIEDYTKEV